MSNLPKSLWIDDERRSCHDPDCKEHAALWQAMRNTPKPGEDPEWDACVAQFKEVVRCYNIERPGYGPGSVRVMEAMMKYKDMHRAWDAKRSAV